MGTPESFQATQLEQMDWRVPFLCAVACLVSQFNATGGVNTSLSTAQSNLSLCFICMTERCQDVTKIFNSMSDDKLWMQACPRLKEAGPVGQAGHNNPIVLTIFFCIGAGFITM
ncbi:uncharacterized protein LOC135563029 isoform X3 [Oncorhynchus nerka]|uniref:uncharacterized protein LOC135563029 isoform X3 n=1 Tax=Oncorhynchus nerka TaxID=8023 RepID=UPI0031B83421